MLSVLGTCLVAVTHKAIISLHSSSRVGMVVQERQMTMWYPIVRKPRETNASAQISFAFYSVQHPSP